MSKKERKKFVSEFKEFISRGSIVDMAVGVVVGGAFTTIVNTLVKSVLTPLINFIIYLICGKADGNFTGLDIVLIPATTETVNGETVVVKEATVLGFSDLITAILNFLLIAFVLFCIIKVINKVRAEAEKVKENIKAKAEKEETEEVEETTSNEQ